jgi:hypothetical protein
MTSCGTASQGGISCLRHLLREPGQKNQEQQPAAIAEDSSKEKTSDPEKFILCRQCNQVITTRDDKLSVHGSHYHTFANPHGLVYDIGCFRAVIGCGYAGPPSDEFTWFKGYRWRVTVCGMCLTHLGWLFMSGSGDNFHGLILDRIIEPSSG